MAMYFYLNFNIDPTIQVRLAGGSGKDAEIVNTPIGFDPEKLHLMDLV